MDAVYSSVGWSANFMELTYGSLRTHFDENFAKVDKNNENKKPVFLEKKLVYLYK